MTMFLIERKNNKVKRRKMKTGQAAHPGFCFIVALEMAASTVTLVVDATFHVAALGVATVSAKAADSTATPDAPVIDGGGSAC